MWRVDALNANRRIFIVDEINDVNVSLQPNTEPLCQLNLLDAALLIQNIAEKENINADVVYLKTETKPFTQNAYRIF